MKTILFILLAWVSTTSGEWLKDFEEAKKMASEKQQLILLNFSGSDWCGPCIRLRKEVFETRVFENFADSNLVLVNADFPRSKKSQLNKAQVKHNESLADRYDPMGRFPLTLLLNAEGKILKTWEGFPNTKPAEFIAELKRVCDANK